MEQTDPKRTGISIVATGGTISNTADGRIPLSEVIESIATREPALDLRGGVRVREIVREGSDAFTPETWRQIAATVQEEADRPETAGIVVTHGTYTVEESAYFVHLTVSTRKPIVFTCSQRRHRLVGNDGDRNLVDAVRVASSPSAAGIGAVVLVNEEIHSAREVTKVNQRPGGFSSFGLGLLGSVEADQVSVYRAPIRAHTFDSEFSVPEEPLPRVDIAAAYAGSDGVAIDAFLAAGARGIVLHGMAYAGRPHPLQEPALERAVRSGVPVVVSNRGAWGRVPANDPQLRAYISGDTLTSQKARVLLSVGLAHGLDEAGLRTAFGKY